MAVYAGIDLHSTNNYLGIINDYDQRLFKKRLPNDLGVILSVLEPFQADLAGVVIESTYNWYWLVDGLQGHGYTVHLANPAAIKQYEGLKHTDDLWDSFWLAHLFRLNILPEGYIYPKEERPVRDLLRRRMMLVRQRVAHILSVQSMMTRNLGINISGNAIKKLYEDDGERLFDHPHLKLAVRNSLSIMKFLTEKIRLIEREVLSHVRIRKEFDPLLTIPGIGTILGLTIMLEVGDISRFPKAGNYASYCRCVKSERLSNKKKKGTGNQKNGNKYLSWAYVEAVHHAIRTSPYAKSFYQRKKAKTNGIVAVKALSNKLCRASYYVMRDRVPFDQEKLFRS
jgi:transposase